MEGLTSSESQVRSRALSTSAPTPPHVAPGRRERGIAAGPGTRRGRLAGLAHGWHHLPDGSCEREKASPTSSLTGCAWPSPPVASNRVPGSPQRAR